MSTCYESILGNIIFLRSCAAYLFVNRTLISLYHPIILDMSYYLCCQSNSYRRKQGKRQQNLTERLQTLKL